MQPRIEDMSNDLRVKWGLFVAKMGENGLVFGTHYALNEVLRTRALQAAYVAQGRTWPEFEAMLTKFQWFETRELCRTLIKTHTMFQLCNALRKRADAAPIGLSDWYQVTWTLNSRHFGNLDDKSNAFDIKVLKGGKVPTWDLKWDGDNDSVPDYLEAARIGRSVGLRPGADFPKPDWPHFQV